MKVCQNVGGISKPAADRQRHSSPLIRGEATALRVTAPKVGASQGRPRAATPTHFTEQHWAGWEEPSSQEEALPSRKAPPLHFSLPSS